MYQISSTVSIACALAIYSLSFATLDAQVDLTTTVNASGTDVVLATISLIDQSGVFSDDGRFLRRVAFVESSDGRDADTFREDYHGGIWQVDEVNFVKTTDTMAHPVLSEVGGIYERLLSSNLNLDWTVAVWTDLRRPLISAVAARIFFELSESEIPDIGDVEGQGEFWKDTEFNTNDEDTVEEFVERVNTLELEECPNRGIDLAFVLDSSGSVGEENFALERNLVTDIVTRFRIGSDATQVSVISYSGFAVVNFLLKDFTNRSDVLQAVSEVEYFDIPVQSRFGRRSTNTADALMRLRTDVFTAEGGARSTDVAIPRVAVVITDGRSNINASLTIPSALAVREEGATVYSIGVGSNIDMEELQAIASSPENVRLIDNFDVQEFQGLRSRITADACLASVPVPIAQELNIQLNQGETSFFRYEVPTEGMTVTLLRQEGNASLFASAKVPSPNPALFDYRINYEGEFYVELEDILELIQGSRRKRADDDDGEENSENMLFVSVEGVGSELNSFLIRTSVGNTIVSSGSGTRGMIGLIVMLLVTSLCSIALEIL